MRAANCDHFFRFSCLSWPRCCRCCFCSKTLESTSRKYYKNNTFCKLAAKNKFESLPRAASNLEWNRREKRLLFWTLWSFPNGERTLAQKLPQADCNMKQSQNKRPLKIFFIGIKHSDKNIHMKGRIILKFPCWIFFHYKLSPLYFYGDNLKG